MRIYPPAVKTGHSGKHRICLQSWVVATGTGAGLVEVATDEIGGMSGQRRRLDGRGQRASGREGGRCETGGPEGEAVTAS